ncbi:DUF817 domain-containing protein [Cellulomonas palmilytica]|uniref:DUF817 domain-containing protein n=1 Tax=Cellulomonas palmilytica TaxID=2608402 RepID=UPI001F195F06|nr:DUF817 domain-containing protein [Cellulomonas palmilytica]
MLLPRRIVAPLAHARSAVERGFTAVEQRIDAAAHRRLARLPADGPRAWSVALVVFTLKQTWACLFGGLLLAVILATRLWYPDDVPLARNDFLTLAALALQVGMLATRLETVAELRVVGVFHVVGTAMELFKTDVGSWSYAADGVLRLGAVPLFSGFMYGAVGSYLVRVMRIFDLRFARYPRRWVTALVAAAIYANFFTHHWWWDARWALVAAVVAVWARCVMHVRVLTRVVRMPVLVAFGLVSAVIWVAENLATFAGAWLYPAQAAGWHLVSPHKLVAWFLLLVISVVLVTWVHVPRAPDGSGTAGAARDEVRRQGRRRRTDSTATTATAATRANSAPTTNAAGPPPRGPGSMVGSADGVGDGATV